MTSHSPKFEWLPATGKILLRVAGETEKAMAEKVREEVQKQFGRPFEKYEAILYAKQDISAVNNYIEVDVGEGRYLHIKIRQDHASGILDYCGAERAQAIEPPTVPINFDS